MNTAARAACHECRQVEVVVFVAVGQAAAANDPNSKDRLGRTVLEGAEFEAPNSTIEFIRKLIAERHSKAVTRAIGFAQS